MKAAPISLLRLQPGSRGRIFHLNTLPPLLKSRLSDLGVEEGIEVTFKRRLPFGGPVTIDVAGQLIGIRYGDAFGIEVMPL